MISKVVPSPHSVTNYGVNKDGRQLTLVFQAQAPPLGFQTYRFVPKGGAAKKAAVKKVAAKDSVIMENEFIALVFLRLHIVQDYEQGDRHHLEG